MAMSDYVRRLREKIGHDFLLVPSVAVVVCDADGRVLLVQHVEGRWQVPGGAIDPEDRKPWRGAFCLTEPIPYVGVETGMLGGKVRIDQWNEGEEPVLHVESVGVARAEDVGRLVQRRAEGQQQLGPFGDAQLPLAELVSTWPPVFLFTRAVRLRVAALPAARVPTVQIPVAGS